MKITKEKKVKMCFLAHNTLGVKRACWNSGIKMNDKQINYSHEPAQTKQQVG
jgi:hypothetical protein